MPTYDYECDHCGHEEEIMHSFSESVEKCPKCNKNKFRQRISGGAGLVFKGSGFYVTDSKGSKSNINTSKTESKTESNTTTTPKESTASSSPANSSGAGSASSTNASSGKKDSGASSNTSANTSTSTPNKK